MIENQTKIGFKSLCSRHMYVTLGVKGLITVCAVNFEEYFWPFYMTIINRLFKLTCPFYLDVLVQKKRSLFIINVNMSGQADWRCAEIQVQMAVSLCHKQ
jgi:hypothetical protein